MSHTRTFTREQLDALGVPHDLPTSPEHAPDGAAVELHCEQVDTRRWVSVHELVFRAPDDGKAYRVHYEQGLTEHQDDHDPWNYEGAVEAVEVEQRPRTVMEWQPLGEQPAAAPSAPADRAAVLTDAERQFLTFALDQAAEEMSLGDGFTAKDEAALAKFRRMADEAQQAEAGRG